MARLKYRIAVSLFVLSVCAELSGATLLLALHFSQNEYIVAVVGGVHGLGCIIAIVSGVWIGITKKRAFARKMDELTLVRAMELDITSNRRASVVGRYRMATRTIQTAIT